MLDLEGGSAPQQQVALARKWRPQLFADIVGQEHAVRALTGAFAAGRMHHAFMLTGTRGIGKTTLARLLAKAFNCLASSSGEPCGECDQCHQIEIGNNPDVIEMDAASTTQVDNMRSLLESAHYAPAAARHKVYIIDEVHMLSRHSFNAMLKTLEEPPDHVKFILATTDPQQVPATVQSRCLRFSLRRLPEELIEQHLAKVMQAEGHEFEPAALAVIASNADGSMRDALSILDEALAGGGKLGEDAVRELVGAAGPSQIPALLELLLDSDAKGVLKLTDAMHQEAVALDTANATLVALLHEAQLVAVAPELSERASEAVRRAAKQLNSVKLQVAYEIASQGHKMIASAPDPKIAFDMTLLRIIALVTAEQASATESSKAPAPTQAPAKPDKPARSAAATATKPTPTEMPQKKEDWEELCAHLKGSAQALARKSVFSSYANNLLRLRLAEQDEHLTRGSAYLAKQLKELFGQQVEVEFETVASLTEATPARKQADADRDKLSAQVKRLEKKAAADGLMDAFPGSEIVPETISENDS